MSMNKGVRSDNSTGFKGVTETREGFAARVQRQERIRDGRVCYDLYRSIHATPEDAAHAYDEAVRSIHGNEEPRFNFPQVGERGLDGQVRS